MDWKIRYWKKKINKINVNSLKFIILFCSLLIQRERWRERGEDLQIIDRKNNTTDLRDGKKTMIEMVTE